MASEPAPKLEAAATIVASEIEQLDAELVRLADVIWDHPETGLREYESSEAQARFLEDQGAIVERGIAGLETAFTATFASVEGGPRIAFLGEFDALPGLSQDRVPFRQPVVEGGPGHGCGHNLLGTAALGAALALSRASERCALPATITYFGCPAEEPVLGKVIMAGAGAFDAIDVALSWHPWGLNSIWAGSTMAMDELRVRFEGRSAHAASAPHMGRSALDAVELMNVGVNFLREHVPEDVRLHYIITKGGEAANVVPDVAESIHRIRARTRDEVDRVRKRVLDCARGAALMTGTSVAWSTLGACHELLPNTPLEGVLLDAIHAVGPPAFDADDRAFAQAILSSLDNDERRAALRKARVPEDLLDGPLHDRVDSPFESSPLGHGSTDVGDVSWVVPTGQLLCACVPPGVSPHSWQFTACVGSSVGRKGMLTAARALALAGVTLISTPQLIARAQQDFNTRRGDKRYASPLPEDFVLELGR